MTPCCATCRHWQPTEGPDHYTGMPQRGECRRLPVVVPTTDGATCVHHAPAEAA